MTVSGSNVNKQHSVRIVVPREAVTIRIGSSVGADDYVSESTF